MISHRLTRHSRRQRWKKWNMSVSLCNHAKVQSFAGSLLRAPLNQPSDFFFCPFFKTDKENKTTEATERCVHELHRTQLVWMQVRNPEHTLLQFKHTHRDATVITLQRKTMGQLLQLPFVLDGRLSSSRFLDLLVSFTHLKKTCANWTCPPHTPPILADVCRASSVWHRTPFRVTDSWSAEWPLLPGT